MADKRIIDSRKLNERAEKDKLWDCILIAKKNKCMLGCSALGVTVGSIIYKGLCCGILSEHSYAIMDAIEIPWT